MTVKKPRYYCSIEDCTKHVPYKGQVCQDCVQKNADNVRELENAVLESVFELDSSRSDGSTASYYDLPPGATTLNDLIQYRNMNHAIGELFCAAFRYGQASHSDRLRDAKKIKFYIEAEIKRLEKLSNQ
jgi:hypothetical protein